jgi:hypothetical protein
LYPLLTPLRARILPGFSLAQILVLATYFYSLIYATFYRSNVFLDPARTGWIAVSQLPFVFALAQKNNVLGSIVGHGYERLNFLHRFVGKLIVLAANIHSIHYFYAWSISGTFTKAIKSPSNAWGLATLVCIDSIYFFSTEYFRQKAYNIFLSTHVLGFIIVLPAVYMHKPSVFLYVLASLGFFLFDHVLRVLKTRLTTATLRPIPDLDVTRVEIPALNAGWRAGQHVRLRILSTGMGWAGWTEAHPFTIASVTHTEEGLTLMCKRSGGWTRRMYELAKAGGYTEGGVGGRSVRVAVEGPYGGPQQTIYASFSAAVLVAGGSGITYALSILEDLVRKDLAGESRVKVIELIWIVPDTICLAPLLPALSALLAKSVYTPVRISVFYTRAPTGKQPAYFAHAAARPHHFDSASPLLHTPSTRANPRRPNALVLNTKDAITDLHRTLTNESTAPLNVKRSGSGSKEKSEKRREPASPVSPASSSSPSEQVHLPPGMTLAPGRPRLQKFIEGALQRAVTLGGVGASRHNRIKDEQLGLSGLVVGVCGPVSLADDVATAVAGVEPLRRDQIGGIEVCEEVFGW